MRQKIQVNLRKAKEQQKARAQDSAYGKRARQTTNLHVHVNLQQAICDKQ